MSKPKTAPQPSICTECLADLYDLLTAGKPPSAIYCAHTETMSFIVVEGDSVTRWRSISPIGAEQAQATFSAVDASRQIVVAAIDGGHKNVSH